MERRRGSHDEQSEKVEFTPTPEELARASAALGLETPVTSLDELMREIYAQEMPDGYEKQVLTPLDHEELAWLTLWLHRF